MAKKVEVFLLKPLTGRWNAGEFITVAPSYAVNVLFPGGIAKIADKQLHNQRETHLKRIAKEKAERQAAVKEMIAELKASGVVLEKLATENDRLFDSVDARSLTVHLVSNHSVKLEMKHIHLEEKIDALGEYDFTLVYEDIQEKIPLRIVRKDA